MIIIYPLSLLIKPASGSCNFKCKYCFYEDIVENRKVQSYDFMSISILEIIVKKALSFSISSCNFIFQGGEPTLVGLDFYKTFVKFVSKYNYKNLQINFVIQTNAYLLDEEWVKFFKENNFLVGVSLDGIKETNDCNRIIKNNKGTHNIILEKINLLKKYNVEYNILTVVTSQVAKNISSIYKFYKENNLSYQQYIPCLDPIGCTNIKEYSLTPNLYSDFLCNLFDLWFDDIVNKQFVYNRYFENLVGMLKGYKPESCGMLGFCGIQNVIEADGSVYPCDFYVLEKYKLGNLITDSFEDITKNREKSSFIKNSFKIEKECNACKWKNLCRGGCKRHRDRNLEDNLTLNYYCSSYKKFFEYSIDRFLTL